VLRVLNAIGLLLQLAGAAATGWGAHLVWREVATAADRFFAPITCPVGRAWRRVRASVRRLICKPPSRTAEARAATSMVATVSARVGRSYLPLAPELDTDAKIAELDGRTRDIAAVLARAESQLTNELENQDRQRKKLTREFRDYKEVQAKHTTQREIRGIRWEATGLALVTLGSIVQALGSFLAPGS
jgi:hypothetical protein